MENEVVTITKLPLKQRQLYKNINRDKNKQKTNRSKLWKKPSIKFLL